MESNTKLKKCPFCGGEASFQKDKTNSSPTKERRVKMPGHDNTMTSEYSEEFDRLRKNRVEVSFHKYGPAKKNYGEGRVDALKTAELCLEAFKRDKNTEHLVDAANYLMFRFMYPMPDEHFSTTDENGSVGTVGTPVNFER